MPIEVLFSSYRSALALYRCATHSLIVVLYSILLVFPYSYLIE